MKIPCDCGLCYGQLVSERTYRDHRRAAEITDTLVTETYETFRICPDEEKDLKLFDGCETSVFFELVDLISEFTDSTTSTKETLDVRIQKYHDKLPSPNNFPPNYKAAIRFLSPYLTTEVRYDSCISDCCLFRKYSDTKDYSDLDKCPECNERRYTKKGRPRKQIIHLPLKDRLLKIFGEYNICKLIYAGDIVPNKEFIEGIQDGEMWKNWFGTGGIFDGCREGALPIALAADSVNCNQNKKFPDSLVPVVLPLLSMQEKYRDILGFGTILSALIPGYKGKEAKSFDPTFCVIVDELMSLTGSTMYNAYLGAPIKIKLALLLYLADFQGFSKSFHSSGPTGFRSCPYCPSRAVRENGLNKCCHYSSRSFLPENSPLRLPDARFPDPMRKKVDGKGKAMTDKNGNPVYERIDFENQPPPQPIQSKDEPSNGVKVSHGN